MVWHWNLMIKRILSIKYYSEIIVLRDLYKLQVSNQEKHNWGTIVQILCV